MRRRIILSALSGSILWHFLLYELGGEQIKILGETFRVQCDNSLEITVDPEVTQPESKKEPEPEIIVEEEPQIIAEKKHEPQQDTRVDVELTQQEATPEAPQKPDTQPHNSAESSSTTDNLSNDSIPFLGENKDPNFKGLVIKFADEHVAKIYLSPTLCELPVGWIVLLSNNHILIHDVSEYLNKKRWSKYWIKVKTTTTYIENLKVIHFGSSKYPIDCRQFIDPIILTKIISKTQSKGELKGTFEIYSSGHDGFDVRIIE